MLRYRLMLTLTWIALHAPRWVTYTIAIVAGELAWWFNSGARAVAEAHVRRALGPDATPARIRRAMRGCLRAAAYYYADLGRYPLVKPDRFLRENVRLVGFEHFERAHAAGRGVIIPTIHYGNAEYVANCMGARGYTFFALTEPIEPEPLAALYQRQRASQGHTFMPVGRGALKAMIRHLRRGGVVCIMVDRDIQRTGQRVPFLGGMARIPDGAVDLARHTGAPLIPALSRRVGWDRFVLYVEPPLELRTTGRLEHDRHTNTARLIQRFEKYLRRDPSQWFVLQEPVWPAASESEADAADGPPKRQRVY